MRKTFDVYQYNAWSSCYNLVGSYVAEDGATACGIAKMNYYIAGGLYYRERQPGGPVQRRLSQNGGHTLDTPPISVRR